ncbi:MAG: ribonuclease R [Pseudomonadales bacterium]|nr:ribonuclease R [Pseudomonadales bacterium]
MSNMKSDPHAQRESENYKKPIHSREYILDWLKGRKAAVTHFELCHEFDYEDADDVEALRRRLIAMTRDGQLICNRRGGYLPVTSVDLIKGRVIGHRDGFGFVVPEDGGDDLFLSARQMQALFNDDVVLVRVDDVDHRGRRIASVVEVLERNTTEIVGRYYEDSGIAFVTPENVRISQDVIIPREQSGEALHGQYVLVELTRQPTIRTKPLGRVIDVLGDHMAPGMEIEVAIRSHGIPFLWGEEVKAEIAGLSVDVTESDKKDRMDLRDLPLVTIDGEDARDFDDAVYCAPKRGGGWRLYVAIADVSHYVRLGSALDEEARKRGNSVYFPGHVVPMLPEVLSNGLCSLNPQVDRLCMVCEMTISQAGRLSGYRFYEAVMHSHARLTYTQVAKMLDTEVGEEGEALRERFADLVPHLNNLYALYKQLRIAREERGAIDFATTETRIEFGDERKIEQIVPVERNDAHRLIEECMLCANVATARFIAKHNIPSLYRVHEGPGEEKLQNLRSFIGELGLQMRGGETPRPAEYQELILQIQDRPDFSVIQTVMLRSMSQAYYGPENKGHFGLGFKAYTHFTSPIRRYPDLMIHRAIKSLIYKSSELLGGDAPRDYVPAPSPKPSDYPYPFDVPAMLEVGEGCSMTERRADDATRDVESWLKCEFLQQHVGDVYPGVISAVTSFGLFVELSDLFIEGLVHVSSLSNDFYHYDAVKHRLVGERTGTSYRLGDLLEVQVVRVDLEERKIDYEIVGRSKAIKKKRNDTRSQGGEDRTGKRKTKRLLDKLDQYSREESRSHGDKTESKGELTRPVRKRKGSSKSKRDGESGEKSGSKTKSGSKGRPGTQAKTRSGAKPKSGSKAKAGIKSRAGTKANARAKSNAGAKVEAGSTKVKSKAKKSRKR